MKKKITIGIIGMFLLASFSTFCVADNDDGLSLNQIFNEPVIEKVRITDIVYDRVTMNNAPNCGNPGEPRLPARGVYVLIPQGEKVSSITVSHGGIISLGSGFLVEPVGEPVIPSVTDSSSVPVPDEAIYSSDDPFPGKLFTKVGTYDCKGYGILVLKLHPVQYVPASGELFFYPDLSVSVETVEDGVISPLFRGLEKDRLEIMDKVENSAMVSSYKYDIDGNFILDKSAPLNSSGYDLLIITTDSLKDGFEQLVLAHDIMGVSTVIKTLSDIGSNSPEDIRDYIRDAYTDWEIEYVLLGGDDDVIPVRDLYLIWKEDNSAQAGFYEVFGPSDLYYGCLDGTWNIPEIPNPPDGDISINHPEDHPEVSASGEGFLSFVWENWFSQMVWKCTNTDSLTAVCKLTFEPPYMNISGMNWFTFSIKPICERPVAFYEIRINSSTGQSIYWSPWDPVGERLINNKWRTYNYDLQYFEDIEDFNWDEVESISIKIGIWHEDGNNAMEIGDIVKLNDVHFCNFRDDCFGEPGEADLCAEVYVGRACVGNPAEVKNFVSKTTSYMGNNESYLKKALWAGEYLGFGGEGSWGGNYKDEIIDGSNKHGYTTIGIPSNEYDVDKLYERDWPGNEWPKSQIIDRINNNVHLINHIGHADYNCNMKIENSDVSSLTNDKYCFIYSQGCNAGGFDGYDCIAEYLTVKTKHGAFAGIWNARSGFGKRHSTDGASNRYDREFWDAVFGENITVISKANQDSKEDNIYRIDDKPMRYVYYGLNLFGDPSVDFFNHFQNNQPNKPDIPTGPTSGKTWVEYEFTACATDPDGHPVQYGWDWDDINPIEWTDFYPSGTPVTVSHSWIIGGSRNIRVKVRDVFAAESEWSEPLEVTIKWLDNYESQSQGQQYQSLSIPSGSPSNN